MPQIETAVFLAAGLGSRLKGLAENKPKGFLEIDGIALIEHSVQNLLASGIRQFYFGTGFRSEVYENFASGYNGVCIKNESYADTGSMYTLHEMKDYISQDFILLEADLLYRRDGIRILNEDPHPDAILASGKTYSGDEVFIETDSRSYLVNMSKNPSALASIDAELVGISKVSFDTYHKMCELASGLFEKNRKLDYEYVFVEVSKEKKIFVRKEENFVWCEIDDESHYQRALSRIYPKLK